MPKKGANNFWDYVILEGICFYDFPRGHKPKGRALKECKNRIDIICLECPFFGYTPADYNEELIWTIKETRKYLRRKHNAKKIEENKDQRNTKRD